MWRSLKSMSLRGVPVLAADTFREVIRSRPAAPVELDPDDPGENPQLNRPTHARAGATTQIIPAMASTRFGETLAAPATFDRKKPWWRRLGELLVAPLGLS